MNAQEIEPMPMLHTCVGCGQPLDADHNSDAHIIPNALGGRLAPGHILCRGCNTELDRVADHRLVDAFGEWPTLLDIPRQRGRQPAVKIQDEAGNEYRVEADGKRTIFRPSYEKSQTTDSHLVEIKAPTQKLADQLIGRLTKEFPQVDPSEARRHARVVREVPAHHWRIRANFAPAQVFPGILAALWLFHIARLGGPFCPWHLFRPQLEDYPALARTFGYWSTGLPGLDAPTASITHKLVLRSVPDRGLLIGYAEILGILRVGGILHRTYKSPAEALYAADPMAVTDLSDAHAIDSAIFSAHDWDSQPIAAQQASSTVKANFEAAAEVLHSAWREREQRAVEPDSVASSEAEQDHE